MAERISNEKNRMGGSDGLVAIENQIKVLYFSKNIEGNDARMNKKLNYKLNDETESFLNQNSIPPN